MPGLPNWSSAAHAETALALHDEVLDEESDLVVDECSAHCGLQAEALSQAARGVVYAAAFPRGEAARGADASPPGSRRSMTSPRKICSKAVELAGLTGKLMRLKGSD
jgi:hypothetical protein